MDKSTLEIKVNELARVKFDKLLKETIEFIQNNPILNRTKINDTKLYNDGYFSTSALFGEKSNYKEIKEQITREFEIKEIQALINVNTLDYKSKYDRLQEEFNTYKKQNPVNEKTENPDNQPGQKENPDFIFKQGKDFDIIEITGNFNEVINTENLAKLLGIKEEKKAEYEERFLGNFRRAGKKTFFQRLFSKKIK